MRISSTSLSTLTIRRLAAGASALAAALVLAACGGGSTTTVSGASSGASGPSGLTGSTTSSTTSTTSTSGSSTSSVPGAGAAALRQNLIQQQGLSPTVANCVVNNLVTRFGNDRIDALLHQTTPPPDILKGAEQAALKCAQGG